MLGSAAPQSLALGQLGSIILNSGAGSTTGTWGRIAFLANTVFETLTSSTLSLGSNILIEDITFPAGTEIQGYFTTIKVTSGTVIAYSA